MSRIKHLETEPRTYPVKIGGKKLARKLAGPMLLVAVSQGCSTEVVSEVQSVPISTTESHTLVTESPTTTTDTIVVSVPPTTTIPRSTSTTTEVTSPPSEVQRPHRVFEHGERIPAQLTFTISRTGQIIDMPLHAFTEAGGNLNDGPILDSGGAVLTGDYPLNIFGLDEQYVDDTGNLRPMAVGYHRTSGHASGRDITSIELGNRPDRQGDILEYNGQRYEAVAMHLVADDDSELLNQLLGSFYPEQTIFVFACTEQNAGSQSAVDAAVSGAYDATDPYLADQDKNPDARILVQYVLLDS